MGRGKWPLVQLMRVRWPNLGSPHPNAHRTHPTLAAHAPEQCVAARTPPRLAALIAVMGTFQRIYRPEIYMARTGMTETAGQSSQLGLGNTDFERLPIDYDNVERDDLAHYEALRDAIASMTGQTSQGGCQLRRRMCSKRWQGALKDKETGPPSHAPLGPHRFGQYPPQDQQRGAREAGKSGSHQVTEHGGEHQLRSQGKRQTDQNRPGNNLKARQPLESGPVFQRADQPVLHRGGAKQHQAQDRQHESRKKHPLLRGNDIGEAAVERHCYEKCRQQLGTGQQHTQLTQHVGQVAIVLPVVVCGLTCPYRGWALNGDGGWLLHKW